MLCSRVRHSDQKNSTIEIHLQNCAAHHGAIEQALEEIVLTSRQKPLGVRFERLMNVDVGKPLSILDTCEPD